MGGGAVTEPVADLSEIVNEPAPPAAEAEQFLIVHDFVSGLPATEGMFTGYLIDLDEDSEQ
jgi:hypothetical protein